MDIQYYREFVGIVENGSYWGAAEKLYTTQSTLSRHMKTMETELCHPLFTENKRKLILTPFGTLLLDYAKKFKELDNEFKQAQKKSINKDGTVLKIAMFSCIKTAYGIADMLFNFQKKYPDCFIQTVKIRENDSLEKAFALGCDFAFVISETQESSTHFDCHNYAQDKLIVAVPRGHSLAKEKTISIMSLQNELFLLFPSNTYLHKMCLSLC